MNSNPPIVAFELYNNVASGDFHIGFIRTTSEAEARSHPKTSEVYRPCFTPWTQPEIDKYEACNGPARWL
jgi:hypothetical protein